MKKPVALSIAMLVIVVTLTVFLRTHVYVLTENVSAAQAAWKGDTAFIFFDVNRVGWQDRRAKMWWHLMQGTLGMSPASTDEHVDCEIVAIKGKAVSVATIPGFSCAGAVGPKMGRLYIFSSSVWMIDDQLLTLMQMPTNSNHRTGYIQDLYRMSDWHQQWNLRTSRVGGGKIEGEFPFGSSSIVYLETNEAVEIHEKQQDATLFRRSLNRGTTDRKSYEGQLRHESEPMFTRVSR